MSYPSMFSVAVQNASVGRIVDGFRIVGIHQETTGNVHMICVYADTVDSSDSGYYYAICGTNGDLGPSARLYPNFYTDDSTTAIRNYLSMIGALDHLGVLAF